MTIEYIILIYHIKNVFHEGFLEGKDSQTEKS